MRERSGTIVSVKYWVDGSGNLHDIRDMDVEHIIHSIKLVARWRFELKEVTDSILVTFEKESNTLEDRIIEYENTIKILVKELNRREKRGEI